MHSLYSKGSLIWRSGETGQAGNGRQICIHEKKKKTKKTQDSLTAQSRQNQGVTHEEFWHEWRGARKEQSAKSTFLWSLGSLAPLLATDCKRSEQSFFCSNVHGEESKKGAVVSMHYASAKDLRAKQRLLTTYFSTWACWVWSAVTKGW